jgi:hypothetical protein
MKKPIERIKAITLLIYFALILGNVTSAQETQSSANKRKFLTSAKVVFEFEQMLENATNECDKIWLGTYIATAAFAVGNTEKTKTHAQTLLTQVETIPKNCEPSGRAIHYGNLVLGHIASDAGNITEAKLRLLEAGKMLGNPALNSFNPHMSLARELLERNERAVVIEYLDLGAKYWKDESRDLHDWKALLQRGGYPDFGYKGDNLIDYKIDAELLDMIQKCLKAGNLTKPFLLKGRKS